MKALLATVLAALVAAGAPLGAAAQAIGTAAESNPGARFAPMSPATFARVREVVSHPGAAGGPLNASPLAALGSRAPDPHLLQALGALAARLPSEFEDRVANRSPMTQPYAMRDLAQTLSDAYAAAVPDATAEFKSRAQASLDAASGPVFGLPGLRAESDELARYEVYGPKLAARAASFKAQVRRLRSVAEARALARALRDHRDGAVLAAGPVDLDSFARRASRLARSAPALDETSLPAAAIDGHGPRHSSDPFAKPESELKGWLRRKWDATKDVLRDTPAEIFAVGAIAVLVGVGLGWHHESAREASIPLAFSEKTQMAREAQREGRVIGPMAQALSSINDEDAKVFEPWNIAHRNTIVGDVYRNFASELENKIDPSMRIHHHELSDYFKSVPREAAAARQELAPYARALNEIRPINGHFDRAWTESHVDHYRTEYYTVTVDDGNGKSHTETRSRQVYDHTTHTYWYHPAEGEAASARLHAFLQTTGDIHFDEVMVAAKATNADGEYAAEKSRRELKKQPTPGDYLNWSRTWRDGSTLLTNLPNVHGALNALPGDDRQWAWDKRTARYESYNTGSHYDAGPREYQTASEALKHGRWMEENIAEILDGLDYARDMTPALEAKAREFIGVALDGKPGNEKKLAYETLQIAQTMYTKNFKAGFEVDRFRYWMVLVYALLFGLGGAAAGFGLDRLGERWWGPPGSRPWRGGTPWPY